PPIGGAPAFAVRFLGVGGAAVLLLGQPAVGLGPADGELLHGGLPEGEDGLPRGGAQAGHEASGIPEATPGLGVGLALPAVDRLLPGRLRSAPNPDDEVLAPSSLIALLRP
ncbi:hypothetical protein, partial [Kitasatospora sp. NPDC059327]|uniref:hypothetical protein n=1 Tax=Kitasatospora sp. NPDC059327 TaxID=3346803 RepID=UPI0036CCCA56